MFVGGTVDVSMCVHMCECVSMCVCAWVACVNG
uniref:Uncharacterized protein n=1 Tax=Anguilla anguilla TaxID=7936 RepID=A0A0E9R081_ANGAN